MKKLNNNEDIMETDEGRVDASGKLIINGQNETHNKNVKDYEFSNNICKVLNQKKPNESISLKLAISKSTGERKIFNVISSTGNVIVKILKLKRDGSISKYYI